MLESIVKLFIIILVVANYKLISSSNINKI